MTYSAPKAIALAGLALAVVLATPYLIHRPATTVSATAAARPAPLMARSLKQGAAPTLPAVAGLPDQHTAPATSPPIARVSPWITLGSYTASPGAVAIGITGGGFAPGEQVDLRVAGPDTRNGAVLRADNAGMVAGSIHLWLAPDGGAVQVQATGCQSGARATATVRVLSSAPIITLAPYAARPGQSLDVQGRGFASDEAVRLIVGSVPVARARSGADGTLQLHAAYTVPDTAHPGFLGLAVVGEQSRRAAWQRLYVVPLRPWATASAYVVRPGDRVQFELHGFAAGEVITVQEGAAYLGRTTAPTDTDGHVAGVGPFIVPTGSQSPTYTFVGARSGARLRVTLTVPQA